MRAGRLEGDLRGVANVIGASVVIIAEICDGVITQHLSNTGIQSANIIIIAGPSSSSASNASIANGGGAEISGVIPGAVDDGVSAVVTAIDVDTKIISAFVVIVTVRCVEELA